MSTSAPPAVSVDDTLGALLIGALFASAFWGVTSVQTFIYYQRYPNDQPLLKLAVAVLWILDTFDACLTSHVVYHYLVTNYMHPATIAIPVWSLIIHTTVTVVTDVIVRCLFSKRVWGLSDGNMILTSTVWILSLADLVVGLLITVKALQIKTWSDLKVLSPLCYASFVTSFAGDLYLSIVLCYYLFKARTGFQRTDTLVNTLIMWIITTGILTSVDAILGTIFYGVMQDNYVFMAFYFCLAKLYINSYLALLNVRRRLSKSTGGPVSIHLTGLSGRTGGPRFATGFTESSTEHATPVVSNKSMHGDLEITVHTSVNQV